MQAMTCTSNISKTTSSNMIKFSRNTDFFLDIESVSLVTDSKSLTKRAAAKHLLKYAKTPNQEDLHIIAVGAYEGTGLNRNGDGFMEKDCESNCHYFKDSDRAVHRHHKNKPADPKFGNIKAAAYNKPMKRVELIVGLDRDKCADILDEQEKTGNTNWSMASKQAYDLCTWCGHKAQTDNDRCEHIPTKIGELNKIGQVCGMMNPNPRWFEISYVRRPADRIGMSLGKMAADSALTPMLPRDFLNIYGDVYVPDHLEISKKACDKRSILKKLAAMEKHVEAVAQSGPKTSRDLYMARHSQQSTESEGLSDEVIDQLRSFDPAKLLKVLAENGIIFGPEDFARYLFGDRVQPGNVEGMKSHLPSVYSDAEQEGDAQIVNNERFEPSQSDIAPKELKQQGAKMAPEHSLKGEHAQQRVMKKVLRGGEAKKLKQAPKPEQRTKEAFDKELAKQYAAYKIAALNYLDEKGTLDEDLMWNAVLQNRR
jgi:hypothetical protein